MPTRRRATTVIEVAMALVILSVALPPLVMAFADASKQSILPANSAVASYLAVERMEEVIARRYRGTDGYDSVTESNFPDESPVSGFTMFSRTVRVALIDHLLASAGSDQGYKKVTVTVSWNSGANRIAVEHIFADFLP